MICWIFNHYANPPDLPGGTRHYDLARELVNRGHKVVIFATSFHYLLFRESRLLPGEGWKTEDVNGVLFVWIRTTPYQRNNWRREWNMAEFMLKAWWLGRKLPRIAPDIEDPDVIMGSSPDLLTALAACWVAYRFSVPFLMEVRDLWPQTILDMGAMSPRHPIIITLRVLEKYLYRRAERIITLLPLAHEYIAACGVPQKRIVWLPNGVDLSRFDQISNPGTPGTGSDLFRVMYLGAHGRANALNVLLEAAKIIQDLNYSKIRIVLVGDGPEKPGLMDLSKKMGLTNTEFRDPVPKNSVVRTLLESDGLILNLEDVAVFKYGISPNKVFEYMAAGKPVIFSVQAANNPVEDSHCGITVPPKDPQALAEAIISLSEMSVQEREEMGLRGRKYVARHHDISVLAERLERTLEEVVHGQ